MRGGFKPCVQAHAYLKIEAPAGLLVHGHDDRLERVIGHLVQNALEASADDSAVTVTIMRDGEDAVMDVSDTGTGMTPDFVRDRLFKPFQTTKNTGTGIGAYESQQYVRQIGGRSRLRAHPTKGLAFAFACVPRRWQRCGGGNVTDKVSETRKPLLIVEDDPALQVQMKWAFDGYEVAIASNREEAIAQLRHAEPAVITLDLGLPPDPDDVSEGFKALGQILELAPDTKVIVLTGQNDVANALRAVSQGAHDFLAKPFEPGVLSLIIERAFRMHELQVENRRLLAAQRKCNRGNHHRRA